MCYVHYKHFVKIAVLAKAQTTEKLNENSSML